MPQAYVEDARARLEAGDPAGAAQLAGLAEVKNPRFADAPEVRGEALLAARDLRGAVAAFARAAALAPRWGRGRLKWGEALLLQGHAREARSQFAVAKGLDLSRPDRAALNVFLARTASPSWR